MPSKNLRWETLQALKSSPKANITYDPYWSERGEVSQRELTNVKPGCSEPVVFRELKLALLNTFELFP